MDLPMLSTPGTPRLDGLDGAARDAGMLKERKIKNYTAASSTAPRV
ncbi:MAG: hypothetical protein Q6373_007165 [Candidatus Sigynarchaeota archaeon]